MELNKKCKLCNEYGRDIYEAEFFSGKKSHYLIAEQINTSFEEVLLHMRLHTNMGKQLTIRKKQIDEEFDKKIRIIQEEYLKKSVGEAEDRYQNLIGITTALEKIFWELYSQKSLLDKDELQRLIVTIEAIRRNTDTILKFKSALPKEETRESEFVIIGRKLIDKIRDA